MTSNIKTIVLRNYASTLPNWTDYYPLLFMELRVHIYTVYIKHTNTKKQSEIREIIKLKNTKKKHIIITEVHKTHHANYYYSLHRSIC